MHRTRTWVKLMTVLSISPLVTCGSPSGSSSLNPLIGGGAGYNTSRLGPDNANCQRQNYSIAITSNNTAFKNVNSTANTTYITGLMQTFLSSRGNLTRDYESPGTQPVSNTYTISGTLCVPKSGATSPSDVQLLVHGIGFDSSYWDFDVPENYSYVRAAADAGFTTFRYDRLGTGLSEKPQDAYNVVQAPTDLAILTEIAQMLRGGQIGGQAYSNILGVGHSYGSTQLQALTATAPTAVDSVILQGFSTNSTGIPIFTAGGAFTTATYVFPDRFPSSELSNAYLATGTPYAHQFGFLYFPFFSDASFQRSRQTEQPVTQGVLFTLGSLATPADEFNGSVHVVTGAQDLPFCSRDCYAVPPDSKYPNIPYYVKDIYPAVTDFSTYIPTNTGHAVNQHYSAPSVYQEMLQFAARVLH